MSREADLKIIEAAGRKVLKEKYGFEWPDARAAERARLEKAVVEAVRAYCASVLDMEENGYPKTMSANEWHAQHCEKQTAMIDAHKDLEKFESGLR